MRRVVVNVVEVGLGAEVVARAAGFPRWQGRLRYPLAAVAALPSYRRVVTTVRTPSWTATLPLSALVVANGRHFGGGMQVAPLARVDDGLFDVLGLHGGPVAALGAAVRLYGGRHVPSPHIAVGRAANVAVTTAAPCLVEADGDVVGTTPATFTLLPGRLWVLLDPKAGPAAGRGGGRRCLR